MASCFCAINSCGNVIIYHTWRNDIEKETVLDVFRNRVLLEDDNKCKPVFVEGGYTYTYIRENNIYLLMVSAINCLPLMQLEFLRHCVQTWKTYFFVINEAAIRDNFVIIYELLDEMCDFGYPQFTEAKVLKSYITQESIFSFFVSKHDALTTKVPRAVTQNDFFPWRPDNRHYIYKRNEIFFDVVEKINATLNADGTIVSDDIKGTVNARCCLSGMPVVEMWLNSKVSFEPGNPSALEGAHINMESIQFHECVQLPIFQTKRKIVFVPPDGSFLLLSYWTHSRHEPPIRLSCLACTTSSSRVTMEWKLWLKKGGLEGVYKKVEVLFPIPCDAHSFQVLHATHGTTTHDTSLNKIVWKHSRLEGTHDKVIRFKYNLPSARCMETNGEAAVEAGKGPVEIRFEGSFAPSGISIAKVQIMEPTLKEYDATPWVRYHAANGQYSTRPIHPY